MKQIILFRHAKSSWKDPSLQDYDRPLNDRGKQAAPFMGRVLAQEKMLPDLIISSTARRAVDTTACWVHASGYEGSVIYDRALYHGEPDVICKKVVSLAGDHDRVMVVAHNPGLEEWLEAIGEDELLPTAAAALLETSLPEWDDAILESFALKKIWRPRELMSPES